MKTDAMIKKLALSQAALGNIEAAVKEAERKTSGEIVLALAAESANYSFWELLVSVISGGVAWLFTIIFSPQIESLLARLMWGADTRLLAATGGIVAFGVTAIAFAFSNIPAIDRLILPMRVTEAAVNMRAESFFVQSGVGNTKERCGILIFMSYLERRVRIIADKGISEKIPNAEWGEIAGELAAGIGRNDAEAAFIRAAKACGEKLAAHFPSEKDDKDELRDGLFILENSAWQ